MARKRYKAEEIVAKLHGRACTTSRAPCYLTSQGPSTSTTQFSAKALDGDRRKARRSSDAVFDFHSTTRRAGCRRFPQGLRLF
jgi:predicted deacylase